MAKLSARGRTELCLLKVTKEADQTTRYMAVMSDNDVLTKISWRNGEGKIESTPWRDLGKLRQKTAEVYHDELIASGYKRSAL